MSRISTKFTKKELYDELQSAIQEDKRYWIQNDAKLRAVVTAQSYDEFRETVAAAHLTPVTKQDMDKKMHTWNTTVKDKSDED